MDDIHAIRRLARKGMDYTQVPREKRRAELSVGREGMALLRPP
jgi:hypothetical protein